MRNKTYSYKPRKKGYSVYATKTYHGRSRSSGRSQRSGSTGTVFVSGALANIIVRGIFGMKK